MFIIQRFYERGVSNHELFISNLQVRNENGRVQPEQVLDVLLAGQRLTQAEQADRADVVIAVGAKAGSPWLTVVSDLFDEDPEKSVSLARELSGKLGDGGPRRQRPGQRLPVPEPARRGPPRGRVGVLRPFS